MNVYHCEMDDKTKIDVKARTAADAIQTAIAQHLGHRVTGCYWGNADPSLGKITFEVPKHDPLKAGDIAPRPKRTDNTVPMFDISEVQHESKSAVYLRDRDPIWK
jgi:hypothetical protein